MFSVVSALSVHRLPVQVGFFILFLLLGFTSRAPAKDILSWRVNENSVEADLDSWDLARLLPEIATTTGWEIYVEPETERIVSVKFKNLPQGEALHRFLGDLNFALVPQSNGPDRLFIYRTSLGQATQIVVGREPPAPAPPEKKVIPNELIVTMKPGSKKTIQELARELGAKIAGKIDGLNTYRLQFEDEASAKAARELLDSNPDVGAVESNFSVSPPTRTTRVQASSTPPFPLRPKISTDASKVVVGLIDTPVQSLAAGMNEFLLPALHVAGDPGPSDGQVMHGTSMAETILQGLTLAPAEKGGSSVRVLPVDVYGPRPETTTFDVANGIYTAINAGATVINLSMAGDGGSPLLSALIQESYKGGVLFFGAAGNQPSTSPTYPAAYPEVVAVTAGDKKGNLAPYANRGSFVDVIAPGLSLVEYNGQSYLVSGTSASTAYVSGTAAGYRSSGKTSSQVEQYIRETMAVKPAARP